MKNILWLCSWYPNDYDKSAANFIQHQAIAVSKRVNLYVLYIHPVFEKDAPYLSEHIHTDRGFTEHIVYYRSPKISGLFSKYISIKRYLKEAQRCFQQYRSLYGSPDYVHVQVPVRAGLFAHQLFRKHRIPYVLTEHYGIYNKEVQDPFLERSFAYINQVRKIIRDAKTVIAVSQSLADDMKREVADREYRIIHNVVDTRVFHYLPKPGRDIIQFLHVSNMIPLKNVMGIIDAFQVVNKLLPNTRLVIAGRATDEVLEHAEKSGLKKEQLQFTGELPYENIAELMQESDAFVMFSNTESMSCVIAEALCCGLPVISTPTGVAGEIIDDSNGVLVEIRNTKQLADAMYRVATGLFTYDRKEISDRAMAMFNHDYIASQIVDCYQ